MRAFAAALRPVLVAARADDPEQRPGFGGGHVLRVLASDVQGPVPLVTTGSSSPGEFDEPTPNRTKLAENSTTTAIATAIRTFTVVDTRRVYARPAGRTTKGQTP